MQNALRWREQRNLGQSCFGARTPSDVYDTYRHCALLGSAIMQPKEPASMEEATLVAAEWRARRKLVRGLLYYCLIVTPPVLIWAFFVKELEAIFVDIACVTVLVILMFLLVDRYQLFKAMGYLYLLIVVIVSPYYALNFNGLWALYAISTAPSHVALLAGIGPALMSLVSILVTYAGLWALTIWDGFQFPLILNGLLERQMLLIHWTMSILLHSLRYVSTLVLLFAEMPSIPYFEGMRFRPIEVLERQRRAREKAVTDLAKEAKRLDAAVVSYSHGMGGFNER